MSTQPESQLRAQVLQRIGDPRNESPASIGNFVEGLRKIAGVVGIDVNSHPIGEGVKLIDDAIAALESAVRNSPPDTSDIKKLRSHIESQSRALTKLEELHNLVEKKAESTQLNESLVNLCDFNKHADGTRSFVIRQGLTAMKLLEMANEEAKLLGIAPAVDIANFAWHKERLNLHKKVTNDMVVGVRPFVAECLGLSRSEQESRVKLSKIEFAALANALEWIESKGQVDSFQGKGIRGANPEMVVRRGPAGLMISGQGDEKITNVGCAAAPENSK